jgi:hypothetical protein
MGPALEYWKKDASWRKYCAEENDAAIAFMSTMKEETRGP